MIPDEENAEQVIELLGTPDLAGALESEQFRHFLDQIPVAIAVAEVKDGERLVYANSWFEDLSGVTAANIEGKPWTVLDNQFEVEQADRHLGSAIANGIDYVGSFASQASRTNRWSSMPIPISSRMITANRFSGLPRL